MSLTDTELDRLADFTVDALDPRAAAQVANLIRTDPRWSAAFRDLTAADAAVRMDLRSAAVPLAMPPDIAIRLDAALANAAAPTGSLAAPGPATARVISLDRARIRRRKIVAGFAAAAAAVTVLAGGLTFALQQNSLTATDSAAQPQFAGSEPRVAGEAAPPAPSAVPSPMAASGGVRVQSSGTNYTAASLAGLASAGVGTAAGAPAVADSAFKGAEVPEMVRQSVPSPLSRLTTPDALAACLAAVLATHPGTVTALDYARYDAAPALIVAVRQAAGSLVVAVGPQCGVSSANELGSAPA